MVNFLNSSICHKQVSKISGDSLVIVACIVFGFMSKYAIHSYLGEVK